MSADACFLLRSYHFDLPEAQIAQHPPAERGASRLLVLPRAGALRLAHRRFDDLPSCLPAGALLVANNARVLPARLLGKRAATGGKAEFLLLTPLPLLLAEQDGADGAHHAEAEALVRCGGRLQPGERLEFGADIGATLLENGDFGRRRVRLNWRGDLARAFSAAGHMPLPPYIRRPDSAEDAGRYQTVYARADKAGAVAAPTAGLHFTQDMRRRLAAAGFGWAEVTLYVGYGTFSPVRCADIRHHRMHKEYLEIPESTARAVAEARAQGRPVVAVGTTSLRALEGAARQGAPGKAFAGWTDIFLYPGARFQAVDGLLTNFHLPESTLLMLVAAFAGRERILSAYEAAVSQGYRFFSYGDAMLITP